MGIGIRKSMAKVRRKEARQASLKACRRDWGSGAAREASGCCSSSEWRVGGVLGLESEFVVGLALSLFSSTSMEPELEAAVGEFDEGAALIERVMSQSKGSGLASETATVTMSPVMRAARFPAKVGYSIPVVETLKLP